MGGIMRLLKKTGFFFLLISASLLSTLLFAGRVPRSLSNFEQEGLGAIHEEQLRHHEEVSEIHERLLKVNTKDYGRYDPTPALSKPPFKLIPN